MAKQLALSGESGQGKFTIVDDDLYEELLQYKWYFIDGYAVRFTTKALRANKECKHLHRYIMGLKSGDKIRVDHINRNTLDNTKTNLRFCDIKQNSYNSAKNKQGSSIYKGVKTIDNKWWQAGISPDRTSVYLGRFNDEKLAALAYDQAARKYFGQFAYLNFPEITDYSDVENYLENKRKLINEKS